MEREIFKPNNPEARYLNRQADLLWSLTVETQRRGEGTDPITRGLRLICFGAYRYMMMEGKKDWADAILREVHTLHSRTLQDIHGQKVKGAA